VNKTRRERVYDFLTKRKGTFTYTDIDSALFNIDRGIEIKLKGTKLHIISQEFIMIEEVNVLFNETIKGSGLFTIELPIKQILRGEKLDALLK
jgi:hypothetical protein